jgi:hypothetical protein
MSFFQIEIQKFYLHLKKKYPFFIELTFVPLSKIKWPSILSPFLDVLFFSVILYIKFNGS